MAKFNRRSFQGDKSRSNRYPKPMGNINKRTNGKSKIPSNSSSLGKIHSLRIGRPWRIEVQGISLYIRYNNAALRLEGDRRKLDFPIAQIDRDLPLGYRILISRDQFERVSIALFDPSDPVKSVNALASALEKAARA